MLHELTQLHDVQEGKVVEMGQHPDLIQKAGLYAQMWSRQAEDATSNAFGSRQSLVDSTDNGDTPRHAKLQDDASANGHP